VDPLTGQGLAECPHQWNGSGDSRLVQQIHAALAGEGSKGYTVTGGQEGLVGRHYGTTRIEGGAHQSPGRFESPDQFDHDVDALVGHKCCCVGGQQIPRNVVRAPAVPVEDGDAGDDEAGPRLHCQSIGPALEDAYQGAADVATAEDR
jgi:hypothetical protein